jgi:hypothetical protein
MKLSVEAKVAAAIALAFAALSIGAIAKEGSEHGSGGVSQMSLQVPDGYLSGHADTGDSPLLAQY